MWRIAYLVFRAVSAVGHTLSRRLTRAGMLIAAVLVASAALGVDTNQTVAYRIFALATALLAVGGVGAWLLRESFSVERALPRLATAGEPFQYRVRVTCHADTPRDALTLWEELGDPRPDFNTFRTQLKFPTYRAWKRLIAARAVVQLDEQPLPTLTRGATIEVVVRGHALRRGCQHFAGITVARSEPLALCNALHRVDNKANLLVLPRRYALPPIALPGSRKYQPGGVALAASVGDSGEFVGLRDYRPGDPLQRIHWRSFARAGKPIVREYQEEFYERHALVLDSFAAPDDLGAFEEAVSIAASFACTVDTRECLLDLMFVGPQTYCYTAGRGQLSAGGLLEVLAGVQPCRDKSFRSLHAAVVGRRAALTGCILILVGWDEARAEFARHLRALGLPLLAVAVTERPIEQPPSWLRVLTPGRIQEGLASL